MNRLFIMFKFFRLACRFSFRDAANADSKNCSFLDFWDNFSLSRFFSDLTFSEVCSRLFVRWFWFQSILGSFLILYFLDQFQRVSVQGLHRFLLPELMVFQCSRCIPASSFSWIQLGLWFHLSWNPCNWESDEELSRRADDEICVPEYRSCRCYNLLAFFGFRFLHWGVITESCKLWTVWKASEWVRKMGIESKTDGCKFLSLTWQEPATRSWMATTKWIYHTSNVERLFSPSKVSKIVVEIIVSASRITQFPVRCQQFRERVRNRNPCIYIELLDSTSFNLGLS